MEYGRTNDKRRSYQGTGGNISVVNREKILWQLLQVELIILKIIPEDIVVIDVQTGKNSRWK